MLEWTLPRYDPLRLALLAEAFAVFAVELDGLDYLRPWMASLATFSLLWKILFVLLFFMGFGLGVLLLINMGADVGIGLEHIFND